MQDLIVLHNVLKQKERMATCPNSLLSSTLITKVSTGGSDLQVSRDLLKLQLCNFCENCDSGWLCQKAWARCKKNKKTPANKLADNQRKECEKPCSLGAWGGKREGDGGEREGGGGRIEGDWDEAARSKLL